MIFLLWAKEYWDSMWVLPYPGPKVCIITLKCLCLYNEGLFVLSYLFIRIKYLPGAGHFAMQNGEKSQLVAAVLSKTCDVLQIANWWITWVLLTSKGNARKGAIWTHLFCGICVQASGISFSVSMIWGSCEWLAHPLTGVWQTKLLKHPH